jgi:hypothetical protein
MLFATSERDAACAAAGTAMAAATTGRPMIRDLLVIALPFSFYQLPPRPSPVAKVTMHPIVAERRSPYLEAHSPAAGGGTNIAQIDFVPLGPTLGGGIVGKIAHVLEIPTAHLIVLSSIG